MPKRRRHPAGWRQRHGAWYWDVPKARRAEIGKTMVRLGATESDAYKAWYELQGEDVPEDHATLDGIFDEWWRSFAVHHYAQSTLDSYSQYLKPLRKVFGHMHPKAIRVVDVNKYRSLRTKQRDGNPASANREASVLSAVLNWCVQSGIIEHNVLYGQLKKVGMYEERKRTRSPTLDELEHFCNVNPHLRGYVTLKRLTGLRKGQMLAINLTEHWDGARLLPPTSKGGVGTAYHGAALKRTIRLICGGRIPAGPLFLGNSGKRLALSGFNSRWRRARTNFVEDGGEAFNEHDIRRTAANEQASLEEAQRLLGHTSSKVTRSVYFQKPNEVEVKG